MAEVKKTAELTDNLEGKKYSMSFDGKIIIDKNVVTKT